MYVHNYIGEITIKVVNDSVYELMTAENLTSGSWISEEDKPGTIPYNKHLVFKCSNVSYI